MDRRRIVPMLGLVLSLTLVALGLSGGLAGAAPASGWAVQPSPNPPGSPAASLAAVSCSGGGTCMAVGNYSPSGGGFAPLAEHFDGTNWVVEYPVNPSTSGAAELTGVSCATPVLCMAVGFTISGSTVSPLVEESNGTTWRLLHTPRPPNTFWGELTAVSCTNIDCIAVGGLIKNGVDDQEQPLTERWNGRAWSLLRTPDPHAENGSGLDWIDCFSAGHCEAVGSYVFADVVEFVFALGWNGTEWQLQTQRNPIGGEVNSQYGVGCLSSTRCESVGSWVDNQGRIEVLAEGWNRTGWIRQPAPNPQGFQVAELFGNSCVTPVCEAVGDWSSSVQEFPSSTLAEQWTGTAWTIQPTPNPAGANSSSLHGVDCRSTTDCVAVGSSMRNGIIQTLVETYSG